MSSGLVSANTTMASFLGPVAIVKHLLMRSHYTRIAVKLEDLYLLKRSEREEWIKMVCARRLLRERTREKSWDVYDMEIIFEYFMQGIDMGLGTKELWDFIDENFNERIYEGNDYEDDD